MNSFDAILQEYASADEERRLSLFLSHRDLRPHFIEIDLSTFSRVAQTQSEKPKTLIGQWIRSLLGWIRPMGAPSKGHDRNVIDTVHRVG
jgi:hypothetical protein